MNALLLFTALFALATVTQARWRVINGNDTKMHEYPSIVSLKYGSRHFCGGTLINPRTVLTAAHCVYNLRWASPSELLRHEVVAVLGEHELDTPTGREHIINVTLVIIPPAYNSPTSFVRGSDIALLRLSRDVEVQDHVQIAALPRNGTEPSAPGDICTVVGWGSLFSHGMDVSNTLQKASLKVLSNNDCAARFSGVYNNPSNVCAGSGYATTSACRGDSGGPLFCKQGNNGAPVQVGIVSYGRVPCGQRNIPTVFTRVSNFHSWIMRNL